MIISAIKKIIPKKMYSILLNMYVTQKRKNDYNKIKNRIISFHELSQDKEIKEVLNYLKNNDLSVFPYEFVKKYKKDQIQVFTDELTNLKYVIHEGKKLFFKRNMTENHIKSLYQGLLFDQDNNSPHLYLTPDFNLNSNDIIADIGCAEGNFSLSNIERVKKIYLFESDEAWIEALEQTFKPWKNKVEIINKFVTNYDSESTISMNTFYQNNDKITFFKVDIEGEEQNFLDACKDVFEKESNIKIVICTYHKQNDEIDFTYQLKNINFEVEHSNGYMIFIHDPNLNVPYLRRGLLRAYKK